MSNATKNNTLPSYNYYILLEWKHVLNLFIAGELFSHRTYSIYLIKMYAQQLITIIMFFKHTSLSAQLAFNLFLKEI